MPASRSPVFAQKIDAAGSGELAQAAVTGPAKTAQQLRVLAEDTPVAAVMTRDVVCLPPQTRVHAVAEMFLDRDLSSAPVVDGRRVPVGMITKTDLLAQLCAPEVAQGFAADMLEVADITRPQVLSLHEGASLSVAAALMACEGVHRLPIVSSAGEVVGIVSTLDIIRWLAQATGVE